MKGTWPAGTERCFSFLRAVPILDNLDESVLWQLATCAETEVFEAGTVVMEEGDASDFFYLVRAGQALVLKRDSMGLDSCIARLACGSYFGELGLLTNQPRSATIEVPDSAPLITYRFDAQAFHRLIAEHVLLFRMQRQRRRFQRTTFAQVLDLRSLPFLSEVPSNEIDFVQSGSMVESFMPGEVVFSQNDPAQRFYIVLDGSFGVEIDSDWVATLLEGDFFGETALLLDSPRTATVLAGDRGAVAWSITRKSFQLIVGRYLLRNVESRRVVLRRMSDLDGAIGEAEAA